MLFLIYIFIKSPYGCKSTNNPINSELKRKLFKYLFLYYLYNYIFNNCKLVLYVIIYHFHRKIKFITSVI